MFVFYSYYIFTGKNIVIVDILSYIAGSAIGQYFTYKLYQLKNIKWLNIFGILFLIVSSSILILFTFRTPQYDIFKDKRDNSFGIKITD